MIEFSKYNILSRFRDSENYFILNQLTGNADILDSHEAERISLLRSQEVRTEHEDFFQELFAKGYFADPEEEKKLFRKKYLDFLDSRDKDEVQLFFVTNYSCNFSCSYCYQDQYNNPYNELSKEIIDAFFNYVRKEFAGRKKYITVFGGEPLLPGEKHKMLIEYLIDESLKEGLDLCIVTNGYTLSSYTGLLKKGRIREIQVTLDGTAEIHNERRSLKGGGGTFEKITNGIDECLSIDIPVNLRMVVDKENISNLPEFAQFAISKGWTSNPLFKTQIGRNYELHHCQSSPDKLFSRITLYEKIAELIKLNPQILQFHKPSYSIAKFLAENGTLPDPLFDSCPACKTEWAFDYTGKIFSCTATVGKNDECLGTFYPAVNLNTEMTEAWQNRDITAIEECRNCNVQLACGGGCGSLAKNRTGNVCSPDCRPIKGLLEIGFSSYF